MELSDNNLVLVSELVEKRSLFKSITIREIVFFMIKEGIEYQSRLFVALSKTEEQGRTVN